MRPSLLTTKLSIPKESPINLRMMMNSIEAKLQINGTIIILTRKDSMELSQNFPSTLKMEKKYVLLSNMKMYGSTFHLI